MNKFDRLALEINAILDSQPDIGLDGIAYIKNKFKDFLGGNLVNALCRMHVAEIEARMEQEAQQFADFMQEQLAQQFIDLALGVVPQNKEQFQFQLRRSPIRLDVLSAATGVTQEAIVAAVRGVGFPQGVKFTPDTKLCSDLAMRVLTDLGFNVAFID